MNAHKFVASKGVEEAKRVLEGAPKNSNWFQEKGKYSNDLFSCNHEIYGEAVMLSELKQVVESLGVICRACGAERIIELHNMYKSNPVGHEYWLEVSVDRMIKAITDYELVESYKSSNSQAINHSCVSGFQENESQIGLSIKQECQCEVLDMVDVSPRCEVINETH